MAFVFLIAISSIVSVSTAVTCSSEVRARDVCYYARHCETNHHGGAGNNTDVDLTVTCSGSSALVSWSAPVGSIVNLQYHCFWTTNNTQVSEFPVVFEERSDFSSGSLNLTSTALMDGVYCIFGGCFRTLASDTFSAEFPNITCGGSNSSSVETDVSYATTLQSVSSSQASHFSTATKILTSISTFGSSSTSVETDVSSLPSVSSSQTSHFFIATASATRILPSISTCMSLLPTLQSTSTKQSMEKPLLVVSIVLIIVAIALITIALVLFCYTFYFWKRISQALTADKHWSGCLRPLPQTVTADQPLSDTKSHSTCLI